MHTRNGKFHFGDKGVRNGLSAQLLGANFFVACKTVEKSPIPDVATETGKIGFASLEGNMKICLFGNPCFFH